MMRAAVHSPIQRSIYGVFGQGSNDLDQDINVQNGAFSNAFSAEFDNRGPLRREFSNAFNTAFASFDRVKSFSNAFSNAFTIETR